VTYRIEVAPAAVRQLRKLDRAAQRRVQAEIELLATEPRPSGAKKLVGDNGEWRGRAASCPAQNWHPKTGAELRSR
jgi:mRNA interferase RelE/StbE